LKIIKNFFPLHFISLDCRYKLDTIAPSKKVTIDSRLIDALYTDPTKIVGIEESKEEVIKMLMEGDGGGQQKRIVSIAGFGGLGKTTLAKAVYDEIKAQFDCTAIVSVSRSPDTQKLLKDILYQLGKKTLSGHP
jgi:disease resistance protein RPM1